MAWHVILEAFPSKKLEDYYRIWHKHSGPKLRDEEILHRLHLFDRGHGEPPLLATYPIKEAAENVVSEVENLGGSARIEEAPDAP